MKAMNELFFLYLWYYWNKVRINNTVCYHVFLTVSFKQISFQIHKLTVSNQLVLLPWNINHLVTFMSALISNQYIGIRLLYYIKFCQRFSFARISEKVEIRYRRFLLLLSAFSYITIDRETFLTFIISFENLGRF